MAVHCLRVYESARSRKVSNTEVEEEVEYFFDKKFTFVKPSDGWPLIKPAEMFLAPKWKVKHMMNLKKELNSMKDKLNDFNLELWHQHTRKTNTAGNVIWTVRKRINPEFMTQAWCKFYEIFCNYPVIPQVAKNVGELNSVHLCEAPGASIAALNHYLKLNYPDFTWDWIATTLNPYYEENAKCVAIPDDRFILYTLDKWKFGPDQTGDIMEINNVLSLVAESKKMGPVLLVTADGSIDCQDQPDEQEIMVGSLLFCETVAALHILSAGGTFVLKAFTMYEHSTICLMYFLNACFETVHVFKPVTSKEGNSENYVVCCNYEGTDDRKAWLRKLRQYYGPALPNDAIFPLLKIPEDFIEQLLQCAERFKSYQEEVLEQNIFLFTITHSPSMKRLQTLRNRIADVFIEKCSLRPLNGEQDEIVGKTRLAKSIPLQMDARIDSGSFNEKQKLKQLPAYEKVPVLLNEVERFDTTWNGDVIKWFKFTNPTFLITHGKPIGVVRTSKFCSGQLLELQYQIFVARQMQWEEENKFSYCKTIPDYVENAIWAFCPTVLKGNVQTINFGDALWSSCQDNMRDAVRLICDKLEDGWRDSNFIIVGFPMLTQFAVGLVVYWASLFEEVGILKPDNGINALVFHNFRPKGQRQIMHNDLLLQTENRGIHSIVPITEIVSNEELYSTIVATNIMTLKYQLTKKKKDTGLPLIS